MIQFDKNNFILVKKALSEVGINHLFANAVVDGHIGGLIHVDNADHPTSFYVSHPYGMSLLFGDTTNEAFNEWLLNHALNTFKTRNRYEWLQAYPATWNELIESAWVEHLISAKDNAQGIHPNKIEVNTRVNFKFNRNTYLEFKRNNILQVDNICRTDKMMFENIHGSVIPNRFWDNANDFSQRAIAFSLLDGDKVASTAFSAFVIGKQLEIGIETADAYRARGYATAVCAALIDYCLEHDYEPVWGCKFENTPSYLLAQKLGFEPTVYWPFYRLND